MDDNTIINNTRINSVFHILTIVKLLLPTLLFPISPFINHSAPTYIDTTMACLYSTAQYSTVWGFQ